MNTAKPFRVDGAGGVDKGEGQPGVGIVLVKPGHFCSDLEITAEVYVQSR